ncbi:MAG: hypothetical protein J5501_04975 [Ruminococcus sp.]|nr:hypothetical protein [Ruminococcus sp.]
MKKKNISRYYIFAGLIVLALGLVPFVWSYLFPPDGIGIIGGADVPTALFIFGRAGKKPLIFIAAGAVLLIRGIADSAKDSH